MAVMAHKEINARIESLFMLGYFLIVFLPFMMFIPRKDELRRVPSMP